MWVRVPLRAPGEVKFFTLNFEKKGKCVRFYRYPPIAQLVEQVPLKDKVVGSIPTGRTSIKIFEKDLSLAEAE